MKIYFIVPGPSQWASTRLRARWISDHLPGSIGLWENQDIPMDGDAYIFIKHMRLDVMETVKNRGGQIWYDVCDPVHWFSPDRVKEGLPFMNGIVTSNDNLTDDFSHWLQMETDYKNLQVRTIPDRLNFDHYKIQRKHMEVNPVRFIWFGASQNRTAMMGGIDMLRWLRARGINLSLTVFDDSPQVVWEIDDGNIPVYTLLWRLDNENQVIASHDIAILPPHPGRWGTIKSNNKTLTSLACGLPVTSGFDFERVYDLCQSPALRQQEIDNQAEGLRALYDVKISALEWAELLNA
jgi:hypothetical protein